MSKFIAASISILLGFLIGCETAPAHVGDVVKGPTIMGQSNLREKMLKRVHCGPRPEVVGHRGASGYTPEHTLHSYMKAIELGADYIEPDLVLTKDRYVIVRHENEMSETTDVATKFPRRKKTKIIDGLEHEGWFSEDFTLAEIKSLRAKERLPFRSQKENGLYEIPTFEEVLTMVKLEERKHGRVIGVAPEIKHSTYFHSLGFKNFEREVVRLLNKYDFRTANSKVMIQSFEISNLKVLRGLTKVPLVQLLDDADKSPADNAQITYSQMATREGLRAIREYADWVSPHKSYIVKLNGESTDGVVTDFVANAQAEGLKVVPYTFRSDAQYLAKIYEGDVAREYRLFFNEGVNALFSDFPDHASKVRDEFAAPCSP